MDVAPKIPVIEFSGEDVEHGRSSSSERWKALCSKVREACESHGCFVLTYDEIPKSLREDMLVGMKALFDLPEETKCKYQHPKPYRSYQGKCPVVPLHESFGIDDATRFEAAQDFTYLMWPQGNPAFCEILNMMSLKMLELSFTILGMIFESFGIEEKQYEALVKDSSSILRVMKYRVPATEDQNLGLVPHTDKNALTILCQNEVQGLEIVTKEGHWEEVVVPKDAFIVIVGDALKAWSNGRLVAVKHRVVMKGDKERYSFGLFTLPKEGAVIEAARELVDSEHPLLYRPFNFADYFSYFVSTLSDDALDIYARV
ncbi:putative fidipidine [Hibiscus syriacus]|uniref:2-oxoglutarate-dependent dioxygenase DAO n=1 Tax=Hibiscus syriacus TaxID=106335 RepID=A0A6A3B090_HIBSY|nr:probable 2-oxoglutarate-dependent dioxygenase AOP1 [Hibiscus syriacus]KAE8710380.1 putative fidipidine [Hibiscus syriacus]